MKCKWLTQKVCVGDPTQPIFHWLMLGFCVGGNSNFIFRVGGNVSFSDFRYQNVGLPNTKFCIAIGGVVLRKPQHEKLCVAVEYRLLWKKKKKNYMLIPNNKYFVKVLINNEGWSQIRASV